jgi:uncharacterized protein involved in exopolysaccharide biosynthesis
MEPAVEVRPGIGFAALRRRWRWVVAAGLVGLLAGYVASEAAATSYTATAVAFLNPLDGNPYSPTTSTVRNDQLAALETEASLLRTTAVGQGALAAAGGTLAAEPENRVTVVVPSNSQVLRISYTGSTPGEARLGAQSFANAYLAFRQQNADAEATEQVERLQDQAAAMRQLLDGAAAQLADADQTAPPPRSFNSRSRPTRAAWPSSTSRSRVSLVRHGIPARSSPRPRRRRPPTASRRCTLQPGAYWWDSRWG